MSNIGSFHDHVYDKYHRSILLPSSSSSYTRTATVATTAAATAATAAAAAASTVNVIDNDNQLNNIDLNNVINDMNFGGAATTILTADNETGNNDAIVAKVTAMLCLFLAAMLIGLIPIQLIKWIPNTNPQYKSTIKTETNRSNQLQSLLLAFGGGVLLATTFLHLLPEVDVNLQHLQQIGLLPLDLPFHLSELLMCIGFFLMYLLEEFVHLCFHTYQHSLRRQHQQQQQQQQHFERTQSIRNSILTIASLNGGKKQCPMENTIQVSSTNVSVAELIGNEQHQHQNQHHHQHQHLHLPPPPPPPSSSTTSTTSTSSSASSFTFTTAAATATIIIHNIHNIHNIDKSSYNHKCNSWFTYRSCSIIA